MAMFWLKKICKRLFLAATFLCFSSAQASEYVEGKPIDLFNGKNLSGWTNSYSSDNASQKVFTVSNGEIQVYKDFPTNSKPGFGVLLTEHEYQNYVLRLEYKWGKNKFHPRANAVRDAGVIFHIIRDDVMWPFGVEMQIQEGDTGDIWIIGPILVTSYVSPHARNYDKKGIPVTRGGSNDDKDFYYRFARNYSRQRAGWNEIKIVVNGDNAKYFLNGYLVNEAKDLKYYDKAQHQFVPLTKGNIALQAEGAELAYRNITLTPLILDNE